MTKRYTMAAQKRERDGKGASRALRRDNHVPAVIYGDKKEPVTITLNAKETLMEYRKGHMMTNLCELNVDGEKHLVLARDVQIHPVNDLPLHVDFMRVGEKTKLRIFVPVHFTDEDQCPGIKADKGILNIVRHEIELFCLASAIPDAIETSLAGKKIGDAIKISAFKLPEGTKPVISNRDFTIATIVPPGSEEVEAPAAAVATAAAAAPAAAAAKAAPAKKDAKK